VLIERKRARIRGVELNQASVGGTLQNAVIDRAENHLGKEGDEVDSEHK
jgi:hypothetical protein